MVAATETTTPSTACKPRRTAARPVGAADTHSATSAAVVGRPARHCGGVAPKPSLHQRSGVQVEEKANLVVPHVGKGCSRSAPRGGRAPGSVLQGDVLQEVVLQGDVLQGGRSAAGAAGSGDALTRESCGLRIHVTALAPVARSGAPSLCRTGDSTVHYHTRAH